MIPWLSCSTKSTKITSPQPWNWTLWWHLHIHLGFSHQGQLIPQPCRLFAFLSTLYVLTRYTCPNVPSGLQPSFHKPLPRVFHIFDNCIMGPTTQLNWPCLSLTTWSIYSQRKMRPATGLGAHQAWCLSSGIWSHCNWQPKKAQWQTSICFPKDPGLSNPAGTITCSHNFPECNSYCNVPEQSSPTEMPSHQRSPTFKNKVYRAEHTTLDATFLGPREDIQRQEENKYYQDQCYFPRSYRQEMSYASTSHTIFIPPKSFIVVQDKRPSFTTLHNLLSL